MFRVIGFISLLALCAGAVHAEDDRSAYSSAQAKLTEQLNAVIAKSVDLDGSAPPAKLDGSPSERALAKPGQRASS
jgi:hypothetical protein